MVLNPRRPHPYQISDSIYGVRQRGDTWVVVEWWREIDRRGEKMDMDRDLHFAPTEAEARAWMEANTP